MLFFQFFHNKKLKEELQDIQKLAEERVDEIIQWYRMDFKNDMTSQTGYMTVEEGPKGAVMAALLPDGGPSGIVTEVQSAFIADRQIMDGPFILNEVMHWCKVKHKQALIFKVDFEKAYDSVRWDYLDELRMSKWKMKLLSIGGRFTLIKSVLGSIPIFHMSIYKVPMQVLRRLESIRNQFFNGNDPGNYKPIWIKWGKVLMDKAKGGLGISSLYAINRGLMIKWLWRFYSQKTALWVRVVKAIHGPDGKVGSMLGNGDSIAFWEDKWFNNTALKEAYPRLYSLERCKNVSVRSKLENGSLDDTFRRQVRGGAEESQLKDLVMRCEIYLRKVLDDNFLPQGVSSTRWVKYVPIKVNILAWKLKMNVLPVRFNLSLRGMDIETLMCPICNQHVETVITTFIYMSPYRTNCTELIQYKVVFPD
ncbi:RNA-directed DNA polymerase, eukaryota, reverse transcriptase zinc-binding domain protein [Tanacetum coccineum]